MANQWDTEAVLESKGKPSRRRMLWLGGILLASVLTGGGFLLWKRVAVLQSASGNFSSAPVLSPEQLSLGHGLMADRAALQEAIRGDIESILLSRNSLNPLQVAILTLIHKKFGVAELEGLSAGQPPAGMPDDIKKVLQMMMKLNGKPMKIKEADIAEIFNPVQQAAMRALYCNSLAVPATFIDDLWEVSSQGAYQWVTALYSLKWMEEQGCIEGDGYGNLVNSLASGVRKYILEDSYDSDDPRQRAFLASAVAALVYVGQSDLIERRWIDRLISEGVARAGEPKQSGMRDIELESAVMGLWALLEFNNPGMPYTPMLPPSR